MTATIVFDFDGTLAIGHGPVMAYAECAAPLAGAQYLERVETALAEYDAGGGGYRDGYDVVGSLAAADGVEAAALSDAYTRSRDVLGTPEAPVSAVEGIDEILESLGRHARLVLATNAPAAGVVPGARVMGRPRALRRGALHRRKACGTRSDHPSGA